MGMTTDTPPSGTSTAGARLSQASAQTLANLTSTKLTLATVTYNEDATEFDTTTTSGRIIALKAMTVRVSGIVEYAGNATGDRMARIHKNGSTNQLVVISAASATLPTAVPITDEIVLAANDYIEVYGYQSSGGNLDVQSGRTSLVVRRVA